MRLFPYVALGLVLTAPAVGQDRPSVAPPAMKAVAPGLAGFTDEVLFGDVWLRPDLSPRDRSVVTLSVLIATGKSAQLTGHLGRALDNGVEPRVIAGIVTHLAFYTGWPNAVSALPIVERVFADRHVDMAALRAPDGPPSAGPGAAGVRNGAADVAPKLADLTDKVLFGDLWRRTDLTPRDRSLVTIAALAANGEDSQLAPYIKLGLQNGLTPAQVGEAFTHLAFYAGWPRATAAVAVLGTVAREATAPEAASPDPTGLMVTPPGAKRSEGAASRFIGAVGVTSPFAGVGAAPIGGSTVTFEPGARTNWHTHPFGQLLVVTAGAGWVQAEGGPVHRIGQGDVVWTPPGVKHWHGATRTSAMTHVAVAETQDDKPVIWSTPVDDPHYHGPE